MYAEGCGVEKNDEEALRWYLAAADENFPRAQGLLGYFVYSRQEYSKAIAWYETASSQGNLTALWRLGRIYRDGKGIPLIMRKRMHVWFKHPSQGTSLLKEILPYFF
jgi:uncharacterized protein